MQKFDRRLVARTTLTELEKAVIDCEAQGWELDPTVPDENSTTVLQALRATRSRLNFAIAVPMRRAIR